MRNLTLLLTLDLHEADHDAYLLDYRLGSNLAKDRWGCPRLLAQRASAAGWQSGGIPLLRGRGPALERAEFLTARPGSRLSPEGRWLWKPHPQAPWPAPHRILQVDRQRRQAEVIWNQDDWEVLDLQPDPQGDGLYFAVRREQGQLWHWCPRQRRRELLIDNADFHPIDFAIHPSGAGLAFVSQHDDQVYYHGFGTNGMRQLSQPSRELEESAYRCSPAFSPDGSRLFYCTASLEMQGGHLCNSGNLYVAAMGAGKLRQVDLGALGCPINLCLPAPPVYAAMAIAS